MNFLKTIVKYYGIFMKKFIQFHDNVLITKYIIYFYRRLIKSGINSLKIFVVDDHSKFKSSFSIIMSTETNHSYMINYDDDNYYNKFNIAAILINKNPGNRIKLNLLVLMLCC